MFKILLLYVSIVFPLVMSEVIFFNEKIYSEEEKILKMTIILDVLLLTSYNCPVWVPEYKRNINKLERIQWRAIKVFMGLDYIT